MMSLQTKNGDLLIKYAANVLMFCFHILDIKEILDLLLLLFSDDLLIFFGGEGEGEGISDYFSCAPWGFPS